VSGMQCAFGWRARNNTAQEDLYLPEIQLSGHESVEYELETAKNSGREQRAHKKRKISSLRMKVAGLYTCEETFPLHCKATY